jgi:hypothetical protein
MDRSAFREPLTHAMPVFSPPPVSGGADELHELRVRIPVDLHRQLLSLKVLRGKSLAETVSLALDIYFADVARAHAEAAAEEG